MRSDHPARKLGAAALTGALLLSTGATVTAQDGSPDLSGQSLVISNWEGYMPEDLPQRFEEATGVPVTVTYHADNEDIVGKLTAGGDSGIDVAFVSAQYAKPLHELGIITTLDHRQIPNLANLYPEAMQLQNDPGNTFSVPYAWGTTGLCYRSDLIAEPTSWMDLLQPADDVAGKTTMMSTERWLTLPAQKALGFSVNTTDEAELAQVKDLLIQAKPTLLAYDDTTFYQRLLSGEAVLVQAWDGWCGYGTVENPDIKFVVPQEGSDFWTDTMVVTESSQNKEAAHAFIDFILRPEEHAWAMSNIFYIVPNAPAAELVDPALFEQLPPLAATPAELAQGEQVIDLGEDSTLYTDLKTEILAQ
jgi:spermidine/putrescine transport system substrate-binding protein